MALPTASDNVFPKVILAEGAAPATPAAGEVKVYAKADGLVYSKDDAGVETLVSGGAGGLSDHNHTGGGDGGDLDAPIIDGYAIFNEESAPSTPASGTVAVYAKADGLMYSKDDAGVETAMSGGGGGGGSTRYLASIPSGALERAYSFASTVESWTTSAGTLSSTGGRLRLTHTSGAVAIEPVGASNVADGEIECDVDTTSMTGSAAVLFRVTDASNFYALIFEPAAGPSFYKCVAGAFSLLAVTTAILGMRASAIGQIRVMIRFEGSKIDFYMNGAWVGTVVDATFSTGRAGIRADNSTMEVDNLAVYSSPSRAGNVTVP